MTSKDIAFLRVDLGITKTHGGPRAFCRAFFDCYNRHHRHPGTAMMTPDDVHHGRADEIVASCTAVLALAHPDR